MDPALPPRPRPGDTGLRSAHYTAYCADVNNRFSGAGRSAPPPGGRRVEHSPGLVHRYWRDTSLDVGRPLQFRDRRRRGRRIRAGPARPNVPKIRNRGHKEKAGHSLNGPPKLCSTRWRDAAGSDARHSLQFRQTAPDTNSARQTRGPAYSGPRGIWNRAPRLMVPCSAGFCGLLVPGLPGLRLDAVSSGGNSTRVSRNSRTILR